MNSQQNDKILKFLTAYTYTQKEQKRSKIGTFSFLTENLKTMFEIGQSVNIGIHSTT